MVRWGDVVARLGHGRRMLVVDLDGDLILCAWMRRGEAAEDVFHRSALAVLRPGTKKPPDLYGSGG